MKRLVRDSRGIPVLKRQDIEAIAEEFLGFFDRVCLNTPRFTPLASIMASLRERGKLEFRLDQDLGFTAAGYKLLGCYDINARVVYIDRSLLDEDPRFSFTVAHELGHYLLHSKVAVDVIHGEPTAIIRDTARHLVLDRSQSTSPRDWIEWQANKFASSLLLPRRTVPSALVEIQRALGITHNLGVIWMDSQPGAREDFDSTVQRMSELYQTSRAATSIRLDELNLVYRPTRDDGIWRF